MKILGQICTMNTEHVIDRSLAALLEQTRPLDEILIVDNGSTDGTLDRDFPDNVTVIRHKKNMGTTGGVRTALEYGIEKGYDWVWIFDSDSRPEPGALKKLLELYEGFPAEVQGQIRLLACQPMDATSGVYEPGIVFTPQGWKPVEPNPDAEYYECDSTIWSGSLFSCEAVRKIGLPPDEYFLDWGDHAYGYRGKQLKYRAFIHRRCIMEHNIDAVDGTEDSWLRVVRLGPLSFRFRQMPPIRLYYMYRNSTYFFLHDYRGGDVIRFLRNSTWMSRHLVKLALTGQFSPEITNCLRGLWDGINKNMDYRF